MNGRKTRTWISSKYGIKISYFYHQLPAVAAKIKKEFIVNKMSRVKIPTSNYIFVVRSNSHCVIYMISRTSAFSETN